MEQKRKIQLILLSILTTILVLWFIFRQGNSAFTDNAYIKSDIVIVRPKVTGYIKEVLIQDNQTLKAGQTIAIIDNRDYVQQVKKSEAESLIAKEKMDELNQMIQIQEYQLKQSFLDSEAAKINFEMADRNLTRSKSLIKASAISQQSLEQDLNTQVSSKNNYEAMLSALKISELKKSLLNTQLNQAKADLASNEASLELAKIDLNNTIIKASTDGIISKRALQIGQLVLPGTSLAYLVQNEVWIIANFKEVQISRMKKGQKALVTIDSVNGRKFTAIVDSLSPATGAEFSILPPENATGNFTKIVQRVPVKLVFTPGQDLSLLRSGLSCEVKITFDE
jgi:membrane fusion protein, multidrug efflux system